MSRYAFDESWRARYGRLPSDEEFCDASADADDEPEQDDEEQDEPDDAADYEWDPIESE